MDDRRDRNHEGGYRPSILGELFVGLPPRFCRILTVMAGSNSYSWNQESMTELVNIPAEGWTLHGVVDLPKQSRGKRVGVLLYHENYNTKFGTHRLFRELADRLAG